MVTKYGKSSLLEEVENERLRSGIITMQRIATIIEGIGRHYDNGLRSKLTGIREKMPQVNSDMFMRKEKQADKKTSKVKFIKLTYS